mmetsp:Transcript_13381/g.21231  ORF Transcript_13381/g.21231 Transcript_13381/m.21231 type:complete len:189 (+) Transcript_13381:57-623(+)
MACVCRVGSRLRPVVREAAALRPAVFLRQTKLQLPHSGARRARCRWDIPAGRRFLSAPPEHVEMPMPRLVPAMEKGVISKWLIAEGDLVAVGDLVCEIDVEHLTSELPQATLLIETHESGYLAKKLRKEGETVSVDLAIAVFCEEAEHVAEFSKYKVSSEVSLNSGAGSGSGKGRLFCWQAYLKEENS